MLKKLFLRFKWQIFLASILSTISAFLGLKMLSIITDIIGSMSDNDFVPSYSFLGFSVIVFGVIAFGIVSQFILLKLSTTIVYQVQKTLLERVLGTDYHIIENNGKHKIMAAMKDDVASISSGLTMIPDVIYSLVTVILCLCYLIYTAWQLFLLVAIVITILIVIAKMVLKYAQTYQEQLRDDYDRFFSNLNALANGGKELHVNHNRKRHFYHTIMTPLFRRMKIKTIKSSAAFIGLDSIVSAMVIFLIGTLIYMTLAFFPQFETQTIVTFTLVILYMIDPLSKIVDFGDEANAVRVSIKKIARLKLADASVFLSSMKKSRPSRSHYKNITLKDVTFTHNNNHGDEAYRFQLGPVSAQFNAGEITFITGGNGSGKSTFAKLISGLYNPHSGVVLADEQEVGSSTALTVKHYQHSINVIFADSFVFSEILNENGDIADSEAINKYLHQLKLDQKLDVTNGKLSSKKMSTGQVKRLALLQSLIEDAPVCIYDEWAADQDPIFKSYFYLTILPELKKKGKVIIVITHDSQYFDSADQLLTLENGKIVKSIRSH